MMLKFKVDENLPTEAAGLLAGAGHDAVTVRDQRRGRKRVRNYFLQKLLGGASFTCQKIVPTPFSPLTYFTLAIDRNIGTVKAPFCVCVFLPSSPAGRLSSFSSICRRDA